MNYDGYLAPCYGCDERIEKCHSTCERYSEYRGLMDRIGDARRKHNRAFMPSNPALLNKSRKRRTRKWTELGVAINCGGK